MTSLRTYSKLTIEAARLLGRQIRFNRKIRKLPMSELAQRAGISRDTLQKIERGDLTCALGLVFEVAVLVGINLFEAESKSLSGQIYSIDDKIALLPKNTHKSREILDDDF